MATTSNPLFKRIQSDGVFSAGIPTLPQNPYFDTGPQTDFGAQNTAANAPTAGSDFLGGTPSLANLGLHPASGPIQAFAPTGLRQQAIAAEGAPVTGFGGATASATQDPMTGATKFNLMQAGLGPQGQPGIDPRPTPAAMDFLATGQAPENPGAFPKLGDPNSLPPAPPQNVVASMDANGRVIMPQQGATQPVNGTPQTAPVPFGGAPNNSLFQQQPPPGGMGSFVPRGTPEQMKAQLGLHSEMQKMQQQQTENAAVYAAYQPGIKDRLSTYMNAGGRNAQMINALRKEQADATASAGKASIAKAYEPVDMAAISKNPSGFDENSGRVYDSLAHAQVDKLTKQMQAMAAVDNPDPKALSTLQDKMFKAQDAAEAQDVLASNKATALRTIDSILPQIKASNMGYSSFLSHLPSSQQKDFKSNVEQLKAIFSVEGLKTLKNVRNEREFDAISRAVANPDLLQSPENFKRVMNNARDFLVGEVGKDTYGKLQQHWGSGGATASAPSQGQDLGDGWVLKK